MSAATKPSAAQPAPTREQAKSLLDRILDQYPNERVKVVADSMRDRVARIEAVLPPQLRGQGQRLAERAVMTLARKPDLHDCPPADFIRCVIEAAELGLAIDGKLCYVVRYKSTWQCQPDYKGLIAVARHAGVIRDAYGDTICANDQYEARRENDQSYLLHKKPLGPRGEVQGAYCIIKLPAPGEWRYEEMNREQLDAIQRRAPSKSGPWATDPDQMRIKTVIRRGLKLYADDPAVAHCLDLMDRFEEEAQATPTPLAQEVSARLAPAPPPPAAAIQDDWAPPPPPPDEPQPASPVPEVKEAAAAEAAKPKGKASKAQPSRSERIEAAFTKLKLNANQRAGFLFPFNATEIGHLTDEQADQLLERLTVEVEDLEKK